nr:DUF882 domain-containing protein [Microvirga pakistanensis]
MVGGVRGTQDAVANGDTRTLTFYHNNTKETLTVTFRRNGQYDSAALQQLNWFLRDWRRSEATRMDPRLFDTVWEVYREVGSSAPVHVNSAYRSPQTNAMLRRRSSVVAKNSQHMQGKALDFYLPDISAGQLRAVGMKLQRGGVGYYPNAYTPFVHLDVGSVRAWPRMTRDQLVRLFPDGKTVHIPTDGRPLPGYDLAKAEVLAGGGTVAGYSAYADAEEAIAAQQPRRKSFWATLFGLGDDEEEDVAEIRTASRPSSTLMASRSAPSDNYADDRNASPLAALRQYDNRNAAVARQAPVAVAQARPEPPPAPAVVAAMAPALREDLSPPAAAPLPPTRISGQPSTVQTASGPTLAWQQGPGVQNDLSIGKGMAFAPIPPRRPGADMDEPTETAALAYAPLPPARPGSLAATNPIPVLSEPRGVTEVAAASSAPLPPPRPDSAIVVAAASAVDIPVTGSTPKNPAKDTRTKTATLPEAKIPGAQAPAAKTPVAKTPQKPMTALSALMSAEPSIHMGFSHKPVGDLATNKFTGPAIKPLPVAQ